MPYFDLFAPIKVKKPKGQRKTTKPFTILEKGVRAVVDINEDLIYLAIFKDGRQYPIDKESYKCKGHKEIYSRLLYGDNKQRLIICRIPDYTINHKPYLPFCVGAVIIGNIVLNNTTLNTTFKIKKCFIDNEDEFAVRITNAFKAVYNKDLEQRIINNYFEHELNQI